MKKNFFLPVLLILLLTAGSCLSGCSKAKPVEQSGPSAVYADYYKAVDVEYALDVATRLTENPEFYNSELGGRTSGSVAENKVADFLVEEMSNLGLENVAKEAFPAAKWQFNSASLTVTGQPEPFPLYSYASGNTPPEGLNTELVYVKKGTAADYAGLDVKGKVVLAEINQRADWWVTLPTLQAAFKGAGAIITYQTGGFSEISPDAFNCQDMCGPVTIPSLSIGRAAAESLIALTAKGPVSVNLKVDNVVETGGTSYNVVGQITGDNPDEMVIIGDHYDTHFTGFQDNSCAVGLTLAIAKGMIQSGYQPKRTILFVLHGAEEYGAIDTPSDWSIGAWNQVFKIHPEWVGKALAYINFELPAFEFSPTTRTDSVPELRSFISEFAKNSPDSPKPTDCFADGVVDGQDTYTYSDDFSYQVAGIPSAVNGFLLTDDGADVFPFYYQIYHSQYDTKETYNPAVFKYNLDLYGALAMAIDQAPVLALDFTQQADRLQNSFDAEIAKAAGADGDSFTAALTAFRKAGQSAYEQTATLNRVYAETAVQTPPEVSPRPDPDLLAIIPKIGQNANRISLAAFKMISDSLIMTSAGTSPIVGHQYYQDNIKYLEAAVTSLKAGQVDPAIDDSLWNVNGLLNYYAYYFDKPVVEHMYNQLHKNVPGNLFWSEGKVMTDADVTDVTMQLYGKYGTTGDFGPEINLLNQEIVKQQALLKEQLAKETVALKAITEKLNTLNDTLRIQ